MYILLREYNSVGRSPDVAESGILLFLLCTNDALMIHIN
jgi:hypothetical protein